MIHYFIFGVSLILLLSRVIQGIVDIATFFEISLLLVGVLSYEHLYTHYLKQSWYVKQLESAIVDYMNYTDNNLEGDI